MARQVDVFKRAIQEYERATRQSTGIDLTSGRVYTWNDVLQELGNAQLRHQNVTKDGILGSVRNWTSSFYKLQKPVESFLRILPTESWQGSVLCGGIKIILSAAGHVQKMREDIAAALERIPCTIVKVHALLGVYDDATIRQSHVSQLFVVILDILQHSLLWFSKSPFKKAAKALLAGDGYGQELQEKVVDLCRLEAVIDGQGPDVAAEELDDPDTVIKLLSVCLMRQLHQTDDFCIIDSVSFYEDQDRVGPLLRLYTQLVVIVETYAAKCCLRVLVTSPTQSMYIGSFQDESEVEVLMVPDVVGGVT